VITAFYASDFELSSSDVEAAKAISSGVIFARELVNAPPNVINPVSLAQAAADLAGQLPALECRIYSEQECLSMGMHSFLAVGAASSIESKLIHLIYNQGAASGKKVALIGKGLTFDSGGYNLKVGGMIELMKFDMGGSAAVLGSAAALAQLSPDLDAEIHFIVATCENQIDGSSMRPGDILTAMDGTTIEVNNTDAEGRLTLCDALIFAQQNLGCTTCVDIATLTGACMVALGPSTAGLMSNDDELADTLLGGCDASGEALWRLPLPEEYKAQLKSKHADLSNIGGKYGGAITAGLFLQHFVQDEVKWAHLDIAGPVWQEPTSIHAGGGFGFGVQTLTQFCLKQ